MKSFMKKKGVAILLMSSIAFFIAILIFANVSVKNMPGPKTEYIGEIQLEMFDYYGQGEEFLFFLELAAEKTAKSINITSNMTKKGFIDEFKIIYAEHLENFEKMVVEKVDTGPNITIKDFDIKIQGSKLIVLSKVQIVIISKQTPPYIQSQMKYKVEPSFKIELEDLKKLKDVTTSTLTPVTPSPPPKSPSTVPLR